MQNLINQPVLKSTRYRAEYRCLKAKKNIKVVREKYPMDFFQAVPRYNPSMQCTFFPCDKAKRTFPTVKPQDRKMSFSADSHSRLPSKSYTPPNDPLRPIRKLLQSQEQMMSMQNSSVFQKLHLPRLESITLGIKTHR